MTVPAKIPIEDAANVVKRRGLAYAIVFGVAEDGGTFAVASYGRTKKLCKVAGAVADRIAAAVLDGRVQPPAMEPSETMDCGHPVGCLRREAGREPSCPPYCGWCAAEKELREADAALRERDELLRGES